MSLVRRPGRVQGTGRVAAEFSYDGAAYEQRPDIAHAGVRVRIDRPRVGRG